MSGTYFGSVLLNLKMKKIILIVAGFLPLAFFSCNEPATKQDPGVKIEGKNGGKLETDKNKMEIEGKKGGELKIDSNGVRIKSPNK